MAPDQTLHIVDLFAGGGGISTGIANAVRNLGYTPGRAAGTDADADTDTDADRDADAAADSDGGTVHLAAINHSEDAIATHKANHPWADHYHAKIEALHPPDVAPPNEVALLAGGPSCTHFSAARGGKPVKEQERASPWHMLRWIELLRPKHVLIENVGELRSWGPVEEGTPSRDGSIFEQYIQMLHTLGYTVNQDEQGKYGEILRAADYGDPTTRKRLFIVASRTKRPTAPPPTHSNDPEDELKDWVPASEIIDWSDRGSSIFTRSKPLASNTLDRIARGITDYCDQRLHPYARLLESYSAEDIRALQDDVVPADQLEQALDERTRPFLVRGEVPTPGSGSEPTQSQTQGQGSGSGTTLAEIPMIMGQHGHAMPRDARSEPVPTVAKRGAIHFFNAQAFVLPRNGSYRGTHSNPAYDPSGQPVHTVTAKNHDGRLFTPFLVQYNGQPQHAAHSISEPLPSLTTRARFALADPELYPWGIDIRYRMLKPGETKQAQGFPEDYEITGETLRAKRKQIGNAVPVNLATALCEHILSAETASLSTFGAGLSSDSDSSVSVPAYSEVVSETD